MARALRIERPGARCHVTARGNDRRDVFRDDTDHFHFLELLSELGERFGARVHAYVLIRGYAGYRAPLAWVWQDPLGRLCGGNSLQEQRAALRAYTESAVLQGGVEPPWERVLDGIVFGSAAFAQQLRREARGNPREQKALRGAPTAPRWAQIVSALEQIKRESWATFANRHGDWGRDAALWLGRRTARFPLAGLGKSTGGLDHAVVSKALARFGRRLEAAPRLRAEIPAIRDRLSK